MNDKKQILIQRSLWYISGSINVKELHPEDTLYKGRIVNQYTREKVVKFMKDNNMPILDEHMNELELKCRGLAFNAGVSTGNLWRSYPSCKVNSFYDNLYPNSLGPDTIKKFKTYFDIEHKRIKQFQDKYQELCKDTMEKGGKMNMPDAELHRYIDTFPDKFEDFVKDRSKYVVDQFYNTLLYLKNKKPAHLIGSIPDFSMKLNVEPELNIIFNRKPIDEDFIAIDIIPSKDTSVITFKYLIDTRNPRYDEFLEMRKYISALISWGLGEECFMIDRTLYSVSCFIKTSKTPSIENIFDITLKDFL